MLCRAAALAAVRRGGAAVRCAASSSGGIVETVSSEIKAAMKAKDTARLSALRNMRATFLLSMKATGADTLSDADAAAALRKLVKQRLDSIAQFTAAGRPENVAAEQAELALIESFLPQLADAATTEAWVVAAIAAVGATKPGDVGKVIGAVTKAHKGEADTAVVKAAAERLLQAKG